MKSGNGKWRFALGEAPVINPLVRAVSCNQDVTVTASISAHSVGIARWLSKRFWSRGMVIVLLSLAGWQPMTASVVDGPIPLAGLRLWLRADQGVMGEASSVTSWQDQSGRNNNAIPMGNAPLSVVANAINGLPAVHFDGRGGYFGLPDVMGVTSRSPAKGGELFVVVRASDPSGADGRPQGMTYFAENRKGGGTTYPTSRGELSDNFGSALNPLTAVPVASINKANLYNFSSSARGSMMRFNRIAIAARKTNTVTFTNAPFLGRDQAGDSFSGDIAEVLVYGRELSNSERKKIEDYLAGKYQIEPLVLPTPTDLYAQGISPSQVSLAWTWDFTQHAGAQFAIYRSPAGQSSYALIATTNQASSYIDETAGANTSYSYEIVAFNAAGTSGTSNPVTVTTPATGTLVPFSGLCLWLKSDSGVSSPLQVWVDQSASGNNASAPSTSNAPSLNSTMLDLFDTGSSTWKQVTRGTVDFSTNTNSLNLPDIMGVASTNPATAGEAFFVLRAISAIPTDENGKLLGDFGTSSTIGNSLYPNDDGSLMDDFGSNQTHIVSPQSGVVTDYSLYNVLSQSGEWTMRFNEILQFTSGTNTFSFPQSPTIGTSASEAGINSFHGHFLEIMVFNGVLTPDQRKAVEYYLASKYMLPDIDLDGDGLTNADKYEFGLNPFVPNPDGIPDWILAELGLNPNTTKNPFADPKIVSNSSPPIVDPTSTTPLPSRVSGVADITLINPDNAVLISSTVTPESKRR